MTSMGIYSRIIPKDARKGPASLRISYFRFDHVPNLCPEKIKPLISAAYKAAPLD